MEKYLNLIWLNTSVIYVCINKAFDFGFFPIVVWFITTGLYLYFYNKK